MQVIELTSEHVNNITIDELTAEKVIFNTINKKAMNVENFIVLLAKQYIYRCRCMEENLSLYEFKSLVTQTRNRKIYRYQK